MKNHSSMQTFYFIFLIWLVLAGIFLAPTAGAAVDFEVLKSLGTQDGKPTGALIQDAAGNFYGTTLYGGSHGVGTVFKIDASGNYSVLYEFEGGSDGVNPYATLVFGSDGSLYGVTKGNSNSNATLFKLSLSGNFSVLYTFSPGSDAGYDPSGGLTLGSDGKFYGATCGGGNSGGTFYRIDLSGNLTVLHSFGTSGEYDFCPASELVQASDGSFYGVTGGQLSYDIDHLVFKIDPAWNYSVLHYFLVSNQYNQGNPDDPYPTRLFQGSDGNIYGVGNSNIYGIGANWVYRLESSGTATVLYQPDAATIPYLSLLIQGSDSNFYGTTYSSADSGIGIVFKLDPSWNYSILYEFDADDPAGTSIVGLVQADDGSLYGTTSGGGTYNGGIIFRLTETQATTTSLTSSLNPSTVGQSVTFTATVTGNSPTGTVEFFVGSTSLGSRPLRNAVASLSTPRLVAGTHSITAVYSGDANNAPSTSAAVTQVVKKRRPPRP
ncbi:choice-of-anchor tandem repeat GloVer-containing protein [Methylosarcina fibrata]|uniref:choice-of-anchor tandem repeat GloVer-containing protein n=1 Tax=Methylosarcina fibrata TaxID=105972 RepID=UPI0003A0C5C8|nr:choice-of-anchor tandem repeat GloVer-containing protein [Methylosarcina fibrata]